MSNRTYDIPLTEKEMQAIVNALSGFYNVMNQEGRKLSMDVTSVLLSAVGKFKTTVEREALILPESCKEANDTVRERKGTSTQ